jgi:hypothetical protein
MSGFIRRFSDFPSLETLREIEGVVTVDQNAPGTINGISAGVACLVGEFADMTYGVAIDANGVVTTSAQPIEVFSGQDLINKLGGFDTTIGEFGGDGGNGWLELKNKSFSRLVVVPINLASGRGGRVFRKLPTNKSATEPTPVVPVIGGTVVAGREFKSGANRVRLAQRVQFAETPAFDSGVDGSVTNAGGAAAFQTFNAAGGLFTTVQRPDGTQGVKIGDVLVLGVIGGAAGLGANADTYRVRTVPGATSLSVEKMDGTAFDWTTAASLPWRIHPAECADTGTTNALATVSGYRVPMRPLDATVAVDTNLTPSLVPDALTASSADALSGLGARTAPSDGLVFTNTVQAPNVASSASTDALYVTAIDSLLTDDLPEREVNIVWCARTSSTIDSKLKSHALAQKANGIGRISIFSPPLDTLSISTVLGDTTPGVGLNRYREGVYCWPGLQTFVGEAVGTSIKGADGQSYANGVLDVTSGSWGASIMSKLAPERNPGQASDPVKEVMSLALGLQRGVTNLGINEYKQLKAKGIMAPRNDRTVGRIFQSGVTRSVIDGEREIYTRRFSFFVEDSIAQALVPYSKELLTESLKDKMVGSVHDFFDVLLSENNKSASRIRGFSVDAESGNTPELDAAGVFVIKYAVEMLVIANTIVQQANIGYGVLNVQQLAG